VEALRPPSAINAISEVNNAENRRSDSSFTQNGSVELDPPIPQSHATANNNPIQAWIHPRPHPRPVPSRNHMPLPDPNAERPPKKKGQDMDITKQKNYAMPTMPDQ
jgi:hypothetical protein